MLSGSGSSSGSNSGSGSGSGRKEEPVKLVQEDEEDLDKVVIEVSGSKK